MKGVQIEAMFPTLFMNASATVRFAGGLGIAFDIHANCWKEGLVPDADLPIRTELLTVPKLANAKFSKNKLKYFGPKSLVNMKTKHPMHETAIG